MVDTLILNSSIINETELIQSLNLLFQSTRTTLNTSFDEIIHKKQTTTIPDLLSHFTELYSSFSCEKDLFDYLNCNIADSDPLYSHSITVALLSRMLGELNHMSQFDLEALTLSALFHDIGKLRVKPEILNKKDSITPQEFRQIQRHTKDGYMMLKTVFTKDLRIASAALMHHERFDGSGYPMGTVAEQINEFARILAITDVYAGMISKRDYRESLCPFEVIRLFEKDGLYKYDSSYVILFLRSMLDTFIGYNVTLNTGETAKIIAINKDYLSKPTVLLNEQTVNLARDEKREILHLAQV